MYASFKEKDNDRYMVEWSAPGFVANIEVTNDLIGPAYKERNRAALKALREDTDLDKAIYDVSRSKRSKDVDKFIEQVKDMSIDQLTYKQYKDFASSLCYSKHNRTLFFKELQKQGYNCVIDDNDKGWTDAPIIVFDRKKTTKVKSVRPLELNEILNKADKLGYTQEDKDLIKKYFTES